MNLVLGKPNYQKGHELCGSHHFWLFLDSCGGKIERAAQGVERVGGKLQTMQPMFQTLSTFGIKNRYDLLKLSEGNHRLET